MSALPDGQAGLRWRTTRFDVDCTHVRVMAIVNVTPDSFSDGGRAFPVRAAIERCEALVREGAHILDIGGESTRPGAAEVPADEEWRRVRPVLEAALRLGVPVSLDTRKARVMHPALDLGVDIVNDVSALRDPAALAVVARHPQAGVCLMHMKGEPATMQAEARYVDVVAEVRDFLAGRLEQALAAGIAAGRVALDPGYGFAKTAEQGWQLLARQAELRALRRPLVVGLSRKSMLGAATGRAVGERLAAGVAAALLAAQRGASVLRVHDVAATLDALAVWRHAGAGAGEAAVPGAERAAPGPR